MDRKWIAIAKLEEISPQTQTLRVQVNGDAVCLYDLDGSIHATQDLCTHGKASLAEGYIENGTIECPLHQGVFDIRTGQPQCAPARIALKVYPLRVEGDTVYIEEQGA